MINTCYDISYLRIIVLMLCVIIKYTTLAKINIKDSRMPSLEVLKLFKLLDVNYWQKYILYLN